MNQFTGINDTFVLHNGVTIPCVGYGTYKVAPEVAKVSVAAAIKTGYRHIDTAAYYRNEAGVGAAIRESGLPRESFFVTSKVWNTDRGYDQTKSAFDASLQALGMDYLDLYLIHWPANYLQYGKDAKALNAETWRALEDLYHEGKVRAIGLSNFMPHHIEALMETARIKPMVDQIELHPGWLQRGTLRYCADNGIVAEAWSPLGRNAVLEDPNLISIASRLGKSVAQLCIRWVIQHGALPLPKSVHPDRIAANTQVFDFILSDEDMASIDSLVNLGGQCARPDDVLF